MPFESFKRIVALFMSQKITLDEATYLVEKYCDYPESVAREMLLTQQYLVRC